MQQKLTILLIILMTGGHSFCPAQNVSNLGREFWVAWGHATADLNFAIFIHAGTKAKLSIGIPGSSLIPFNGYLNANETRLFVIPSAEFKITEEGVISTRAVHIESDVPVSAFAHHFTAMRGEDAAGSMLYPVETYGQTYYSLNMKQVAPHKNAYSWFFVIASENNTRLQITPSGNTHTLSAGSTYTIELNKGQLFNVFGIPGDGQDGEGTDLTGSSIKSVQGADGICHPVALFSGSSMIIIAEEGNEQIYKQDTIRDNLLQQVLPARAWGTRYLSAPTVMSDEIAVNNTNVYRVAVRDPATIVTRNGTRLTGLKNNFYYEFESDRPEYLEADKQIFVAQYIPCQYPGQERRPGDAEMMYISPMEQGNNEARFYNTEWGNIRNSYIQVIIPEAGERSLLIDGSQQWDRTYPHPGLPGYLVKIKQFPVFHPYYNDGLVVSHSITCDVPFTTISYGLGLKESYAFNAGALINNLEIFTSIDHPRSAQLHFVDTTCVETPFQFYLRSGYRASRIEWWVNKVPGLVPGNEYVTWNNPVPYDSAIQANRMYYYYHLLRDFRIMQPGEFKIPVKLYAADIDNCDQSMIVDYLLKIKPAPVADFTVNYSGIRFDQAIFTGTTRTNDFQLKAYAWNFTDGSIDSAIHTVKQFSTTGSYPVKYTIITKEGCSDDTVQLVMVRDDFNMVQPPNVFSPNGDGIHDTWEMPDLVYYRHAVIQVFNRWGQLVYSAEGYNKPWNGKSNNKPLPAGTYYYLIESNDGARKRKTGTVTILR